VTPKDWERLEPLYGQALSLPPEERAALVEKVFLEDAELGRTLAALLAQEKIGTLDTPLVDFDESALLSEHRTVTLSGVRAYQVLADRFRILRHVGKGGMGEVFEAEDLQLKDRVALKIIRPDIASNPQVAARFKQEIRLGKRVAHPNVCRIHDLGSAKSDEGVETLFLTMEFLRGETLSSRIKRGPMSESEALPLIADMADGLDAAHQAGVVHRDFKSGNVMLVGSPDRTRAVITDFGLARALREGEQNLALTKPGTVAGTVDYMAPEQIRGEEVTPSADIYSFGVVIYQMVTGRLPFVRNTDVGVAMQHLHDEPPSPRQFAPHLDPKWEAAILCCLKKAPVERFSSGNDVKTALRSGSASSRPKLALRRRPRVLASLALLIVLLLASAIWAYRKRNPDLMNSQQRVAVLEFENIGGDPANRAFCEGLMETLSSQLTELEQFHGALSVVPASDIRREKVTSVREAKQDFGVTLVITGSVQRSPSGMRLTINVVDAQQLTQLRSRAMFVPVTDAVSMQQGVITQITDLLDIQLRPEAQRRLAEGNTPVPGAYDLYLQGSGYLVNVRTGTDQAIAEFRHALERDPDYALAHAGLGEAYWNKYSTTKDRGWIDQAWRECKRSIELGPKLAAPHITLALLNSGAGRYDEAIREARQAIQIDPYNDRGYSELARALQATNQPKAAEATMKKAIELRPNYWSNYVRLGIFYGQHTRYQEAEMQFERVIELVPDNPLGYTNLASVYHLEGRDSDAEKMLKKSIQARPTPRAYSNLATVYFFERRYADAVPIMEKLVADGTKDYLLWGNLGDAYRWTPGNTEKATRAYQQAIALALEAIEVNSRDAMVLSMLALYRAKLGQTTPALQSLEKALAAAPDDKTVLFNAAMVCELAGERARALKLIERAVIGGYSPNEIATEPELEKLRQDPKYQAAVSRNNRH
jgi:serine/threonine protein kinase/tetratricopeptide (TPR) repeat protein